MRGARRFGWLSAAALAAGLMVGTIPAGADTTWLQANGPLVDLQPAAANATDGAWADLWSVTIDGETSMWLFIEGLDPAAEGATYGVHIHVGPCEAGNGAAAGPHYNSDGGVPSTENEVWLDFTVLPGGYGYSKASVPFEIQPGTARSMVVHLEPTQAGGASPGAAGGRQACLPAAF